MKTDIDFYPSPEENFQTEGIQMKKTCFCGILDEVGAKWIHVPIAVQKKSDDTGQCAGVRPSCKSYWSRRKMSFLVVLPTERHGLDKLIQDMTPECLIKSFSFSPKDDRKNLELTLPAFHINTCTDFKPALRKLGLQSAFGKGSGLFDTSIKQRLFLSNIKQKGQIVVDQFGARTSQKTETNFPCQFCEPWEDTDPCTVDEPFLFFVVDNETSLPLIAGKVSKPEPPPWQPLDDENEEDDFSQCQQY
ncbi:hypothetical protein L9F63_020618 [Diploptera punctata]|uniref:Serpin domain-containing protein n=1 Tax=Diploptera punctata TaxID=6984 RepID=A0AAD8ECR1_DIPPU|nr:hypothetical protein L9F63_020618 [Diploptera punctata]